jgi:hypothetical protein
MSVINEYEDGGVQNRRRKLFNRLFIQKMLHPKSVA